MIHWITKHLSNYNLLHDVIECLIAALEAKDIYTSGHSNRVADMSYDICRSLGLSASDTDRIHIAAHLHDIGKIGIQDQVLNKKGKLLPHEWSQIERHPEIGYTILFKSKKLTNIAYIVLSHHERWDGKGYPRGLKGDSIPLGARIIAISDSIDAMTSQRPYRKAFTWDECQAEIVVNKGAQFDPVIVDAISQSLWTKWQKAYSEPAEKNIS
jgi:putative nucleotidyltransferase with HDIG domain